MNEPKGLNGLILTRKPGEAILIGDDIEVRVLSVRGNNVSLAIRAPREVAVWREEIKPAPGEERRLAA